MKISLDQMKEFYLLANKPEKIKGFTQKERQLASLVCDVFLGKKKSA